MAIYHLSVKTVSRSSGRSAVAAAAYRSGEKLTDYTTGEVKDYTRKGGVLGKRIITPIQNFNISREQLWNMAEQAEKRKNSTVAREIEVALPAELSADEREKLVTLFCHSLAQKHQVAVDYAIHEPSRKGDERNYHAHILMTTRRLTEDGKLGEKTREWDDKKQGAETVKYWRENWAYFSNMLLEKYGEKIDNRTLEEQGVDREPTKHKGVIATAMERKGTLQSDEELFNPSGLWHSEQELSIYWDGRIEQEKYDDEILTLESQGWDLIVKKGKLEEEEKLTKNTLTRALQDKHFDIRLIAMTHPRMKPEWLQKVIEKHPDKTTVQAAKTALASGIYDPNKEIPLMAVLMVKLPKLADLKQKIRVCQNDIGDLEEKINQIEKTKKELNDSKEEWNNLNNKKKAMEAERTMFNTLKRKIGLSKSQYNAEPLAPIEGTMENLAKRYYSCKEILTNEEIMKQHKDRQSSLKEKITELEKSQREYNQLLSEFNKFENRQALQGYLNYAATVGNYKTDFIQHLKDLDIKIDSNQTWQLYQEYRRSQPDYEPPSKSHDKGHGMSR